MPKSSLYTLQASPQHWQQQLAQAITEPLELLDFLGLNAHEFPQCQQASQDFKLKVPRCYAKKMEQGNPLDPLFLQVMSQAAELNSPENFVYDPVDDLKSVVAPGLIHKYPRRVLLIATGVCAIHCRYCFRRHFPYSEHQSTQQDVAAAMDYIRQHTDINEVILSGGDPLLLSDQRLAELITQLEAIPHIKHLRIHSRLAVVLPARINNSLTQLLEQSSLQVCMVIHANHANEIADDEFQALQRLQQAGVILLNQSVLLAGINDEADILSQLSERLFSAHVLPYYLHLLDPVAGAAHYDVSHQRGKQLIHAMQTRLAGYLVPRLVREIPGKNSKTPAFEL